MMSASLVSLVRMYSLAMPNSQSRDLSHLPEVYTMPPSTMGLREESWPLFRAVKVDSMETTNWVALATLMSLTERGL